MSMESPVIGLNTAKAQMIRIKPNSMAAAEVRVKVQATEPAEEVKVRIAAQGFSKPINGTILLASGDVAGGRANIIGQYHKVYRRKVKKKST